MLLIDDILLSPMNGIMWAFKEIHKAATEEVQNQSESITLQLGSLYMQLETGKITEEDFNQQEKILLDQLDRVARQKRIHSRA